MSPRLPKSEGRLVDLSVSAITSVVRQRLVGAIARRWGLQLSAGVKPYASWVEQTSWFWARRAAAVVSGAISGWLASCEIL
jgi:hypothetical protein